jgi:hypothetical protein
VLAGKALTGPNPEAERGEATHELVSTALVCLTQAALLHVGALRKAVAVSPGAYLGDLRLHETVKDVAAMNPLVRQVGCPAHALHSTRVSQ